MNVYYIVVMKAFALFLSSFLYCTNCTCISESIGIIESVTISSD